MTEQKKQSSWFGRFLKVLLRLFLTLVFGILVGAALYFGFQFAYQQLVIPTQQNAADLQNFQTRVDQQWELLQDKIRSWKTVYHKSNQAKKIRPMIYPN